MSDNRQHDEEKLIDYLLGELDERERQALRGEMEQDGELRRLHASLSNALTALGMIREQEIPQDLTEKTLARVASARRTEALIQREEIRRRVLRPVFSWREVAAIAASIILIVSIALPTIQRGRQQMIAAQCASNLGGIGAGLQHHAIDHAGWLPGVDASDRRWLPDDRHQAASNSNALFQLLTLGYEDKPDVFQCPAGQTKSFVVRSGMTDFPSEQHVGYSYQHSIGEHRMNMHNPAVAGVLPQMAILADRTPLFLRGRFLREAVSRPVSPNHNHRGQNVLYLDMHVDWSDTADAGVDGDNIYLADGVTEYQGTEAPRSPTDTFLLPAYSNAGR